MLLGDNADLMAQQFLEALTFYKNGRLSHAQEACLRLLALQPNHFEALHLLAIISAQSKEPEQAIELFDAAIRINPKSAEAHYARACTFQGVGQYGNALEGFDKAVELNPGFAEAYNNRARVLQELKQYDTALENLDKAILLMADYAYAHANRGNVCH